MKFGDQVRKARRIKGITQVQLCEKLGVAKSTVAMWESTDVVPGGEMLEKLSNVLGVPITFGDFCEADTMDKEEGIFLSSFRGLDTPGREAVLSTMAAEQKRIRKGLRQMNGR